VVIEWMEFTRKTNIRELHFNAYHVLQVRLSSPYTLPETPIIWQA